MPTGVQADRWQAIADTTTIGSSLVDLKEKGATPQDRRFLYVDCIKRTIEPDHHLLNHLVTSFVAQVERVASECRFEARCCIVSGMSVGNCFIIRMTGADKRRKARRKHNNSSTVVYTYLP